MTAKTIGRGLLTKALAVLAFAIAALTITFFAVPSSALAESELDIKITQNTPASECVYGNKVEFSVSYDAGSSTVEQCNIYIKIDNEPFDECKSTEQSGTYDIKEWNADKAGSHTIDVHAVITYKDTSKQEVQHSQNFEVAQAPLTITAKNKTYAYNGNAQGPGDIIYADDFDKYIIVEGLKGSDELVSIMADGQGTALGTYDIILGNATINNKAGDTVTGNYAINYVPGKLTIATACEVAVTIEPDESGGVSGAGPYEPNATVSLTATPNTGYRFVNWTSDDVDFDDPTKTTVTFKMPTESVDVTANFESKAKVNVVVNKDGVPQDGLADYLYFEKKGGSRLDVVFVYSNEEQKYIYDPATTKGEQLATGDYTLKFDPPASSGYMPSSVLFSYDEAVYAESTTFDYYTVEFVNYDDTVLQSGAVAYREMPEYTGATPTKPATAQCIYEFAGWDPAIGEVTSKTTYKATFTEKEKGVYEVVSGAGSTWTEGSGEPLAFVFKRTANDEVSFDNFKGILIDGKEVPKEDASGKVNYTVEKGSVIVSLQPSYLATLSEGKHTLTAQFKDGDNVDASFSVDAKPSDNKSKSSTPKTGDSTGGFVLAFSATAFAALCVIVACIARRRKA